MNCYAGASTLRSLEPPKQAPDRRLASLDLRLSEFINILGLPSHVSSSIYLRLPFTWVLLRQFTDANRCKPLIMSMSMLFPARCVLNGQSTGHRAMQDAIAKSMLQAKAHILRQCKYLAYAQRIRSTTRSCLSTPVRRSTRSCTSSRNSLLIFPGRTFAAL